MIRMMSNPELLLHTLLYMLAVLVVSAVVESDRCSRSARYQPAPRLRTPLVSESASVPGHSRSSRLSPD